MSTTCTYPPASPAAVVTPTFRPLWQRLWLAAAATVAAWRHAARQRAEWRALEGLSDETLRDIGMAERLLPRQPTLPWVDVDRGRW